jgi:hypothetical protein
MADDLIQWEGGVLVADLLQEASITDACELTQFPIEDGSLINDHLIRQPQKLSLTLVQVETPLSETKGFTRVMQELGFEARSPGTQKGTAPIRQSEFRAAPLMALSSGIQSLLFGGGPAKELSWTGHKSDSELAGKSLKVHVLQAGAPVARVNEFHDALLDLMLSASPCIVTVKGHGYADLILTSVTRTDAQGQVGRASFQCEFQHLATVETKVVNLPPVPKAKAPKVQAPKPPAEASADLAKKARESVAELLVSGAGSLLP